MRAVTITGPNHLELRDVPTPEPGPGEVRIRVRAAALNHRDLWIKRGEYSGVTFPCIPGSDVAGEVEALGAGVSSAWSGQRVTVNPAFGWGPSAHAQGPQFSILGLPRAGALAEAVVVPVEQVCALPSHLRWEEAGALPLAGLTAYRALFSRGQLRTEDRVLITGVGGGVALTALQLAVATGARVWVTSSRAEKLARAAELGAAGGFNYQDSDWSRTAGADGGYDLILDGSGGPAYATLIDLAAPGGRIVSYGATHGNPAGLALRKVFWRQLSLLGATMGSPADWTAMIEFVALHRIRPDVSTVLPLERAPEAFALMERGGQFGKIVLSP